MYGLLKGKKIVVTGVASESSIAYSIAQTFKAEGADIVLNYQTERLKERVLRFAEALSVPSENVFQLDVAEDSQIDDFAKVVKARFGKIDGLVHSMAFAPREALGGKFVDVTDREAFKVAGDISAYSFIALARAFRDSFNEGASLITLSYLGAEKVVPNYNVMGVAKAALEASMRYMAVDLGGEGVRVNAVSAGPIRTLAASGIKDFRKMLDYNGGRAPIQRNITAKEVGQACAFLASPLASGITGEVLHVDGGFSITAMGNKEVSGE